MSNSIRTPKITNLAALVCGLSLLGACARRAGAGNEAGDSGVAADVVFPNDRPSGLITDSSFAVEDTRAPDARTVITGPDASVVADSGARDARDAGLIVDASMAATEGALRIASPTSPIGGGAGLRGRLEIFSGGEWGTVCDDNWTFNNTQVACRQLGFFASAADSSGFYTDGAGTGTIILDDVACAGTETRLMACSFTRTHNCSHAEDVGVQCYFAPR